MLFDDTQSAPTPVNGGLSFPRDIEFAQALDRYMTSYIAEQRRRLQRPRQSGLLRRLTQQLAALPSDALERLGSAMSGGGRSPPVGVM
jgi:hypothetical protein